jgi:uncharacterized repeat protein (TIGR01451 family)
MTRLLRTQSEIRSPKSEIRSSNLGFRISCFLRIWFFGLQISLPFSLLLLPLVPARSYAQAPLPPLPMSAPAPLLYVRLMGPPSLQATIYQGPPPGRVFDIPFIMGLRPGYLYRLQLSGIPDRPALSLYPTLEVIGALQIPPKCRSCDHPATVEITERDIHCVLAGGVITKVVYLEDPCKAVPVATEAHQPLEFDVPPTKDPLAEASCHGRPVLILRLGQRQATPLELAHQTVPGTMLLPNDKFLPPAACKPMLPGSPFPLPDPHEECLRDGGDCGYPLGIGPGGRLGGLDPGDTAAEYTNCCGERRVVTSNCVCICVPRFIVVRGEIQPAGYETVVELAGHRAVEKQIQVEVRQPSQETHQNAQVESVRGQLRPSVNVGVEVLVPLVKVQPLNAIELEIGPFSLVNLEALHLLKAEQITRMLRQIEFAQELYQIYGIQKLEQVVGPQVVGQVQGLGIISSVQITRELSLCCCEAPCLPDKPLVLCKWVDCKEAHIGDVVTFYLKYSNHGGKPITEVAVSDSLTGRLEYVPDSARSNRDAVFTLQSNEVGSTILRWEVSGRLLPGQSGVVSFQARIR